VSEKTPDDIFKLARDENIEYVDVRFCDLPGTMQHFTIPIYVFDETVFEKAWPSTAPRFADSSRSTSPTCCCFPTRKRRPSTRSAKPGR